MIIPAYETESFGGHIQYNVDVVEFRTQIPPFWHGFGLHGFPEVVLSNIIAELTQFPW